MRGHRLVLLILLLLCVVSTARAEPPVVVEEPPGAEQVFRDRAANIRALIGGDLALTLDAESLFILDLSELPPVPEGAWLRFAAYVHEVHAQAGAPRRRRKVIDPPDFGPEGDPIARVFTQLATAYADFFALPGEQQESLIAEHISRQRQAKVDAERETQEAERAERTLRLAEQLEQFLAGTLDLAIDPRILLKVNLITPGEVTVSEERRRRLLSDTDAPAESETSPEERLDRARLAFARLSADERKVVFAQHEARKAEALAAEPEVEEEEEIELIDPDVVETQEAISDADQEVEAVTREKEEAIETVRKARSEALRVVGEERVRLLEIKQEQAQYAADLPRRRQQAQEIHELALEWDRKIGELLEGAAVGANLSSRTDPLYKQIREPLGQARHALRETLGQLGNPGAQVPNAGVAMDEKLAADVDRADLNQLRAELDAKAAELRTEEAEIAWESARSLRDDVVLLNRARLELLQLASSELRDRMTGLGADGVSQVQRELDQIALELRFHALSLPRDIRGASQVPRRDPVGVAFGVLQILVAMAIFRWWRRRSADLLRRWQYSVRRRAGESTLMRTAVRAIWYARRVHAPFEWLVFVGALNWIADAVATTPEFVLLRLFLLWGLGGWAAVLFFDALAARQSLYLRGGQEHAALRIRSLRLIGITVASVGLLLSLTAELVGRGAVYHWVWQLCWVLLAPIALWLVLRWRSIVFQQVKAIPSPGATLKWIGAHDKGLVGFLAALIGGLYLLLLGLWRFTVRQLSGLDATRKLLAYLFRREVAKQAQSSAKAVPKARVPDELYDKFDPEGVAEPLLTDPCKDFVAEALQLSQAPTVTLTAIVGERGAGKTTFLNRLVGKSEDITCHVTCPPGGFHALIGELAKILKVPATPTAVAKALDEGPALVCVDDAQRMIEPAIGGLADLDRFTKFALEAGGDCSWIVAIEAAAWQYVQRARGERVFFDQIVDLPRWSEKEIAKLIQSRTKVAEVTPNFDALVAAPQVDTEGTEVGSRTEIGYYRLLWDHSRGNPAVALQAWRESLRRAADPTRPVVQLFQHPSASEIDKLPLPLLFVLRAIVQLDVASRPSVVACTQIPDADVADAIRFSITRGYIEQVGDRVRLSWPWYRTITTVLNRQHLLGT